MWSYWVEEMTSLWKSIRWIHPQLQQVHVVIMLFLHAETQAQDLLYYMAVMLMSHSLTSCAMNCFFNAASFPLSDAAVLDL